LCGGIGDGLFMSGKAVVATVSKKTVL